MSSKPRANAKGTLTKRFKETPSQLIGKMLSWKLREEKKRKGKLNFSTFLTKKEREHKTNFKREQKKKSKRTTK